MSPADLMREPSTNDVGEQDIRNDYARLTATLEQLESDLAPLLPTWSPAAQESYLACKKQWDDATLALSHVLFTVRHAAPGERRRWA